MSNSAEISATAHTSLLPLVDPCLGKGRGQGATCRCATEIAATGALALLWAGRFGGHELTITWGERPVIAVGILLCRPRLIGHAHGEGDTLALQIHLQHLHLDDITGFHHFARILDEAIG